MNKSPRIVVTDLLDEHFDELEFLWGQRQVALTSPEYVASEVRELESRIDANVHGLLVMADQAIPFLEEKLGEDEPAVAFSAAYVLLRLGLPKADELVWKAFWEAKGPKIQGICQALCHGPIDRHLDRLREAMASAPAPLAAAVAEVLAFHAKLGPTVDRLTALFGDENADVRRAAWRVVALVESKN